MASGDEPVPSEAGPALTNDGKEEEGEPGAEASGSKMNQITFNNLKDIERAMEMLSMYPASPKSTEEALKRKYEFWQTQPVPKLGW